MRISGIYNFFDKPLPQACGLPVKEKEKNVTWRRTSRSEASSISVTHRYTVVLWERVTLQLVWPRDAEAGHQTLAAPFGSLTERPAGPLHLPRRALGGVHGAHEQADVHGAHALHHGVEEGHLHDRLSLTGVAQEVGSDGLVVGQALAHGYGDGLTDAPAAAHAVLEGERRASRRRIDAAKGQTELIAQCYIHIDKQ